MFPIAVLCGGRGTRVRDVTNDDIPKALIEINDRPFIDYKLDQLTAQGFEQVVLLVGVHGDQIRAHLERALRPELSIAVCADGGALRGTGGAVRGALSELGNEFWVTYGDTLIDVPVAAAEQAFRDGAMDALMVVLRNDGRWGASNARVAGDSVLAYGKDPVPDAAAHIDFGMTLMTQSMFETAPDDPFDLTEVLSPAAAAGRLRAFSVTTRFYEIGTPDSVREVADHLTAEKDR